MKPGTFQKGDPRINRRGRIDGGETVKKLLKELGREEVKYNGVKMPKYKAVLLKIIEGAIGGEPQQQKLYLEYLYGKPTQMIGFDAENPLTVASYDPETMAFAQKFLSNGDNSDDQ